MRTTSVFIAIASAVLIAAAGPAERPTLRFDMGTDKSPVAKGALRVAPDTAYSASKGYGWESKGQTAFDSERPKEDPRWHGPGDQAIPKDIIKFREFNDVTRDGVAGKDDLIFRADAPDGAYRVAITLGNMDKPICSEQIFINDVQLGKDVDAKHYVRRGMADALFGYPKTVRYTVQAKGGAIRIRIHGDDSGFNAQFAEECKKPVPYNYLLDRPGDPADYKKEEKLDIKNWGNLKVWVWQDIGGPFVENSVMGIDIYPFVEPPLWWQDGKLSAAGDDADAKQAVDLFNAGQFAEAEKAFDAVKEDYTRALGWLWLAGRPQYEQEMRLVPKALEILRKLERAKAGDLMFGEILENARRMDKALYRFVHRADEQRAYNELIMISGEVESMQPEDPLYYKGLIYAGRGLHMVIPSRHTFMSGAGAQRFQILEKDGFADNRFVKWYLHNEWANYPPDWVYPDYSAGRKGAPEWAAAVYEAFNRQLDLCEWWLKNRQAADGSLGGGWGDDVEILRDFGTTGAICADASPITVAGVRKLANGAWNSGSIDTDAGYFTNVGDTEHTGEWTGDTLLAMVRTDYGNPVYLERALKTAKLMRDLWMRRNPKGDFLMRSNFLGATGVGGEGTENDSRINFRPASPAWAVLGYNNSPTIQKMFNDWTDSWLAASLSTEKGKPKGIIPQEIGFAASEVGGTNSPAWHKAWNRPGTVNYNWEGMAYHDYIVGMLLSAHQSTGDPKYLEPMKLEDEFVKRYCPKEVLAKASGGEGKVTPDDWKNLPEGSNEWIAAKLAMWPGQWEAICRVAFPEQFKDQKGLRTLAEAAKMAQADVAMGRKRWPHVTTECIATDRVYWPGMGSALQIMTGFSESGGGEALATYRGLGREFAAAVLRADAANLNVVMFNVSTQDKEARVLPWLLRPGAEYTLKAGPDADNDGKMDKAAEERPVELKNRGQEIAFKLPGRTQYVVEIARTTKPAKAPALMPDLAVSPEDIEYVPDLGKVVVTVHNVGSAAAKDFEVQLMEDTGIQIGDAEQQEIGNQRVTNLEAPLSFDPQTVRVEFSYKAKGKPVGFGVLVDPRRQIEEITKVNNAARRECQTPQVTPRMHGGGVVERSEENDSTQRHEDTKKSFMPLCFDL